MFTRLPALQCTWVGGVKCGAPGAWLGRHLAGFGRGSSHPDGVGRPVGQGADIGGRELGAAIAGHLHQVEIHHLPVASGARQHGTLGRLRGQHHLTRMAAGQLGRDGIKRLRRGEHALVHHAGAL